MRNLPTFFATVVLGTTLSVSLWSLISQQLKSDGLAESQANESVEIRLARAHLKLAKMDVQRAVEANKRIAHLYSSEFIEKLRLHVANDEAELEQYLKGKDRDSHQVCIRSAEAALKIAELNVNTTRAVHERVRTANSAFDMERAKVVGEIATLDLERAKQLDNSDAVVTHLQRQIDQLRHQVLELQMRR